MIIFQTIIFCMEYKFGVLFSRAAGTSRFKKNSLLFRRGFDNLVSLSGVVFFFSNFFPEATQQ